MTVPLPPLWPHDLPLWPVPNSVRIAQMPSRISFAPSRGLPIERPATTASVIMAEIRLPPVSRAQAARFWSFYETDIARGALRFAWVHPLREVLREVRIVEGDGSPSEVDSEATYSVLSFQIQFIDVLPGWASQVSTARGFIERLPAS
jgi:hypothetical protein